MSGSNVTDPDGKPPNRRKLVAILYADMAGYSRLIRLDDHAEVIIVPGHLGAAHAMKLINNFIAIGTWSVVAEAIAAAQKLGVDLSKLFEVVSAGNANSNMFQVTMPWVLHGDA